MSKSKNCIYFSQDRIKEMAEFLMAIRFNGGSFEVIEGPDFGWYVHIK